MQQVFSLFSWRLFTAQIFPSFYRSSSGAQWLQWQPLVLPSCRGDSRAVFVNGPAGPTTNTAKHVSSRLETHPLRLLYGNRRLRLQFKSVPDDGQNVARNMLGSVYTKKIKDLTSECASGWWFYLSIGYMFWINLYPTNVENWASS
jgi:hypothetical protein